MFKSICSCVSRIQSSYHSFGQKLAVSLLFPTKTTMQCMLFIFGSLILACAYENPLYAQSFPGGTGPNGSLWVDQSRFSAAVKALFIYIEGSFGALVMVTAGIGSILSAAFGQYRSSLSMMVVALGSFVLRSLVATFFNDPNVR
jgi:hypothetical protein